ncbi:hypothetical protein [Chitinilyticum aquatile]|uniref:hypothetical protein n=1 Tax=Chitinilyticum aquatile TaxID=362520 RepID=UPI000401D57D|nr:hypothetical protein [Chitinilyticum aquatile]
MISPLAIELPYSTFQQLACEVLGSAACRQDWNGHKPALANAAGYNRRLLLIWGLHDNTQGIAHARAYVPEAILTEILAKLGGDLPSGKPAAYARESDNGELADSLLLIWE